MDTGEGEAGSGQRDEYTERTEARQKPKKQWFDKSKAIMEVWESRHGSKLNGSCLEAETGWLLLVF